MSGDELERLRVALARKDQRIAELEAELARVREKNRAGEQFVRSTADRTGAGHGGAPVDADEDGDAATAERGVVAATSGGRTADRIDDAHRSIDDEASRSIGDEADRPIDDETGRSIGDQTGRSVDQEAGRSIDIEAGRSIGDDSNRPTDDEAGRPVGVEGDPTDDGADIAAIGVEADAGLTELAEQLDDAIASLELQEAVASLDRTARRMLACYRNRGTATPTVAHAIAGGSDDRIDAHRTNAELYRRGFIDDVGPGRYAYALPSLLEARCGDLEADRRERLLRTVEAPLRVV